MNYRDIKIQIFVVRIVLQSCGRAILTSFPSNRLFWSQRFMWTPMVHCRFSLHWYRTMWPVRQWSMNGLNGTLIQKRDWNDANCSKKWMGTEPRNWLNDLDWAWMESIANDWHSNEPEMWDYWVERYSNWKVDSIPLTESREERAKYSKNNR